MEQNLNHHPGRPPAALAEQPNTLLLSPVVALADRLSH